MIARSARPLDAAAQRALWSALAAAGVTEPEEATSPDDGDPTSPSQIASGSRRRGCRPTPSQISRPSARRSRRAAQVHGLEAIWFVKVETGIDGVAWLELATPEVPAEDDEDAEPVSEEPAEVVDAIFDEQAEVLYAAPDAPPPEADADEDEDDEDEDDEDDEDDDIEAEIGAALESHWRNGAPPFEHSVAFPIERYPEIIEDYDWESFGIALKLTGTRDARRGVGDQRVLRAVALRLSGRARG